MIGVVALLGGLRSLIRNWRRGRAKDWIGPVFLVGSSLLWIYLHNFPHTFGHINRLVNAYQQKQYQIVEGPVQVLHQQPKTGHSKGDIVSVSGTQFEVNYFLATPAYHKTLAHSGALSGGTYARIYYFDGEILRVDLQKAEVEDKK